MRPRVRISLAFVCLAAILVLLIKDSSFHFNAASLRAKREHHSAQRHWNIWFKPEFVYYDSPLRYQTDLRNIADIVEPGSIVLSDRATSYYAAATLPAYVLNVHKHHRSVRAERLVRVLSRGEFCYLEDKFHRKAALSFLQKDSRQAQQKNWPQIKYILLNKDKQNIMLRNDCLALRSEQHEVSIPKIGELLYEGTFLNLYKLKPVAGVEWADNGTGRLK